MQGLQSCFHQGAVLLSRGHLSTSRHLYDKIIIQPQMSIVEVEKPRCKEEVLRKSYFASPATLHLLLHLPQGHGSGLSNDKELYFFFYSPNFKLSISVNIIFCSLFLFKSFNGFKLLENFYINCKTEQKLQIVSTYAVSPLSTFPIRKVHLTQRVNLL